MVKRKGEYVFQSASTERIVLIPFVIWQASKEPFECSVLLHNETKVKKYFAVKVIVYFYLLARQTVSFISHAPEPQRTKIYKVHNNGLYQLKVDVGMLNTVKSY